MHGLLSTQRYHNSHKPHTRGSSADKHCLKYHTPYPVGASISNPVRVFVWLLLVSAPVLSALCNTSIMDRALLPCVRYFKDIVQLMKWLFLLVQSCKLISGVCYYQHVHSIFIASFDSWNPCDYSSWNVLNYCREFNWLAKNQSCGSSRSRRICQPYFWHLIDLLAIFIATLNNYHCLYWLCVPVSNQPDIVYGQTFIFFELQATALDVLCYDIVHNINLLNSELHVKNGGLICDLKTPAKPFPGELLVPKWAINT